MRKITQEAVKAFFNNQDFKKGNTKVYIEKDDYLGRMYTILKLHGNTIAEKDDTGKIFISDAGWQTNTTKERLNGILERFNMKIVQRNWQWFLQKFDNNYNLISEELFPLNEFIKIER